MSLFDRHRGIIGNQYSVLPDGFKQIPCIKSIKAYIDTGVISTSDIRFVFTTQIWRGPSIIGTWGLWVNNMDIWAGANFYITFTNVHNQCWLGYNGNRSKSAFCWDTDVHTYDFSNGNQSIDNIVQKTYSSTFEAESTITLGTNACPCKMYSSQIYDNGILIRDYIPVVRISDNKYGMYDLCGSTCTLTNSPFYISPNAANQYGDFYFE